MGWRPLAIIRVEAVASKQIMQTSSLRRQYPSDPSTPNEQGLHTLRTKNRLLQVGRTSTGCSRLNCRLSICQVVTTQTCLRSKNLFKRTRLHSKRNPLRNENRRLPKYLEPLRPRVSTFGTLGPGGRPTSECHDRSPAAARGRRPSPSPPDRATRRRFRGGSPRGPGTVTVWGKP